MKHLFKKLYIEHNSTRLTNDRKFKKHMASLTKFCSNVYIYICIYICILYIYIYTVSS